MNQQMSGRQAAKSLPFEFWYALPARTDQIREQVESQLPPAEVPAFRAEIQRRAILAILALVIFLVVWCAVTATTVTGFDGFVGAEPETDSFLIGGES